MQRVTKAIAAIMLMVAMCIIAGCTKPTEPNNNGNNNNGDSYNGHEYVNLGLPSGTLWATCNVGAINPEDFGYYFAWGETTPKDVYSWNTYKWSNGGYDQLTKYCTDSSLGYNGYVDNMTSLQTNDDAAKVNWGGDWHTPTQEEWQELIDYSSFSIWTTQNGVNGRLFTGTNGKSIFFPDAGYRCEISLIISPYSGSYWSNSLYDENPNEAMHFTFNSRIYAMSWFYRFLGFPVRPVCSSRQD